MELHQEDRPISLHGGVGSTEDGSFRHLDVDLDERRRSLAPPHELIEGDFLHLDPGAPDSLRIAAPSGGEVSRPLVMADLEAGGADPVGNRLRHALDVGEPVQREAGRTEALAGGVPGVGLCACRRRLLRREQRRLRPHPQGRAEVARDLARDRADAAGRKLGELNSVRTENERKLQLLLSYRDDYRARFQQVASGGIDMAAWHNFHAFMHKLDAAISEQRKLLESAEHGAEAGRTAWLSERRKVKSYDTLTLRRGREALVRENRREQREQDEFALAAQRRRPAKRDAR